MATKASLADGLTVPTVGVNAFATGAPLIDKVKFLPKVLNLFPPYYSYISSTKLVKTGVSSSVLYLFVWGSYTVKHIQLSLTSYNEEQV